MELILLKSNKTETERNMKQLDSPNKTLNDGKLYQKIGKRYYPVSDLNAFDGLAKGSWLVTVDDGCISTRVCVEPNNAAVDAAFGITEEKLVTILAKACEARPKLTALTTKELRAMKAYLKVMGKDRTIMFSYSSLSDIAKEIITSVKGRVQDKRERTK